MKKKRGVVKCEATVSTSVLRVKGGTEGRGGARRGLDRDAEHQGNESPHAYNHVPKLVQTGHRCFKC